MLTEREIYDKRFEQSGYDNRSRVRVLTAEREAIEGAITRAVRSHPTRSELTICDFGFGNGRVTTESALTPPQPLNRNLLVVAHDVASVGLMKAANNLIEHGFSRSTRFNVDRDASTGYIIGDVSRTNDDGGTTTFRFVHGNEHDSPEKTQQLITQASDGNPLVTVSFYSGLEHIPGTTRRNEMFDALITATDPTGEFLITVSGPGDMVEAQEEWAKRLKDGTVGSKPVEDRGDIVYLTELGQENFAHIFSYEELLQLLKKNCNLETQKVWIEAIRAVDEEFQSKEEEQNNYKKITRINRRWASGVSEEQLLLDCQSLHTIGGFRSGSAAIS